MSESENGALSTGIRRREVETFVLNGAGMSVGAIAHLMGIPEGVVVRDFEAITDAIPAIPPEVILCLDVIFPGLREATCRKSISSLKQLIEVIEAGVMPEPARSEALATCRELLQQNEEWIAKLEQPE